MKKILLLFFIIPFALGFYLKINPSKIFSLNGVEKVCVVTDEEVEEFNSLKTAQCNYVMFDSIEDAEKVKPKGFVIYMKSDIDKIKDELNLMIDRSEEIDDMKIYYGFTPNFSDFVLSNNKRINAQIVVRGEDVIAGFPMILTGF